MLPKAARTSMNLSAPLNERSDALAQVQQEYFPNASDMPPAGDVQQFVATCLSAYEEQALAKGGPAVGAWNGLPGPPSKRPPLSPKTILTDEMGLFGSTPGGYRRRPSQFGAEHLRMMVEHTPLLNAVISRRQRTIKRFLRPSERDRDVGFEIRKKDDERPLRANDDAMEHQLNEYLLHSGMEADPIAMRRLKRDSLTGFMDKSIRDLLTLDAWAIETVMTRNHRHLAGYHAIDAGTVYLVSEEGYEGNDRITAIQLVNGRPVTTYTDYELTYLMQNPRTDILHAGYGYPPTEMVVKVVTGYLNALTYNLKGFDSNAIPKGLLTLYGSFDTNQLTSFKNQWNAMVKGVNNTWALPVMVSDSKESAAHYEKLGNDFSDMYFAKWMVLLTSIVCSIYGMDPSEVYSEAFHAGKSSLSGSDRAEALADARDTGLEPLMSFLESSITDNLLARIAPEYKFRFFGLQPVDRDWRKEMTKLTKTVNEAREQDGEKPLDDPIMGNAPLNPSLTGLYLQQVQAQQAAEQAAAGQPAPGDVGGDDPHAEHPDAPDEEPKDGDPEGASPTAEESGDRDGPPAQRDAPQLEEQGDRDEEDEEDAPTTNPEKSKRDRFFGPSTMAKSRHIPAGDIVVMG